MNIYLLIVGWIDKALWDGECTLVRYNKNDGATVRAIAQLSKVANNAGYALALGLGINHQNMRSRTVIVAHRK